MSYTPDYYFYIKITLANKADASDTETLYVGNRAAYGETSIKIYNAVTSISGLDSGSAGGLPRVGNTRVDIDNSRGIFGANRRFVDFLDKYTITYQDVEIYTAKVGVDASVSASATKRWVDKVLRVSANDERVSIYLRTDLIKDKEVCCIVNRTLFPDAPSDSIGKAVPLIIGSNQQVKPLMIDEDGNSSKYAYGTTYGSHFVNAGAQKYYARDYEGDYVEVKPVSADYTDKNERVYGLTDYDDPLELGGATAFPEGIGGLARLIDHTSSSAINATGEIPSTYTYIITSYRIEVYKRTAAPNDEQLQVKIWEKDPNTDLPGRVVGDGGVVESHVLTHTSWNTVAQHFKRPVILKPGREYYFGFTTNYLDDNSSPTNRLRYKISTGMYDVVKWVQEIGTGTGTGHWSSDAFGTEVECCLYGADWSETTSPGASYINDDGKGVSYFTLDCTAPSQPDMKTVDWIVEANGLQDTSGGGVTGTGNKLLDEPHHLVDALMYEYNGSWTAGNFNSTTYADTHNQIASDSTAWSFRKIGGSTRGKTSLTSLLSQVCQESLTFLSRVDGENATALYAYGVQQDTAGYITDKDIIGPVTYDIDSRLSVVNMARASFNRKLTQTDFENIISQGGELSYSDFVEFRYDDNGTGQLYSSVSQSLFDEVENAKKVYNWISDTTSIKNILSMIFAQSDLPTEIVSFNVLDERYQALKQWDVIELYTPHLPQTGGTSVAPQLPVYDGSEQSVLEGDDQIALAKTYRAQILSIKTKLSEKIPLRQITARLLINKADPT